MPHTAFTAPWIDAWAAEIRASDDYRAAAQRWEWPILFVLRADPAMDVLEDRYAYLDVYRGECREARLGTPDDVAAVPYVLSAGAPIWKGILEGALDPIVGIMRGQLRLEKGSIMTLGMHTAAATALVATAARIETAFPDAR